MDRDHGKKHKLGVFSGVYVPVVLSIISILMFLRFGVILGEIGLVGMLGLLILSYVVDFLTTLSLSAVASNGEVKGGGTYYLISRSLGPEFGGSIGLLFYLSQVLNTALNIVGLIDCLELNFFANSLPRGYWWGYVWQTAVLFVCGLLCLAGSGLFAKASNGLLVVLSIATLSIPLSAIFRRPFSDPARNVEFTGISWTTLQSNLLPHPSHGHEFRGLATFRDLFGILFPATSGIFAGASMSGDLRNPSRSIPGGTLWAMLTTFVVYLVVILSMAASTAHASLLMQPNIIQETSVWGPIILAGECAVSFFSALMGLIGAAKLMQALGRDKLLPGLSAFAWGTKRGDEPLLALLLTYAIAQLALFADLNQIATFISMGYMVTFFVMNLACFLLKIGSAPNFRPAFKFFSWQTAFVGSVMSALAMFFIDETYASSAVVTLVVLFLLIHYLSPPKRWGDVSQNLIYHQVRKYLLRLKPEHIKFWRPQIILLTNDPRRQTRLIQFCNSMKKGSLYILGHVIVTDDFASGVLEAKLQQTMWTEYITEYSRIKAFVQLAMSPSITWGVRNLILNSGLGGMRPNIAMIGFYNMDELRQKHPLLRIPTIPDASAAAAAAAAASSAAPTGSVFEQPAVVQDQQPNFPREAKVGVPRRRRRGDTSSRLLEGVLPTDVIKTEGMMKVTDYLTILEDLALRHRINVAVAKGFHRLETPRDDNPNAKRFIDLWPIQMSAELEADGKSVLTTNFDTYTLILQLGYILHSVPAWKRSHRLRVMVFVEYESEVEEERGRVEALLEKLRISAEVHVFWLASGELATYDEVIHGQSADPSTEAFVNEVLKEDSWWQQIQEIRGKAVPAITETPASPNAAVVAGGASTSSPLSVRRESMISRRRPSVAHIQELQRHNTVSALSRLGLSMGIRTQNLAGKLAPRSRHDSATNDEGDTGSLSMSDIAVDSSSDGEGFDTDFNDLEAAISDGDDDTNTDTDTGGDDSDDSVAGTSVRHPLLSYPAAALRYMQGDKSSKKPLLQRRKNKSKSKKKRAQGAALMRKHATALAANYGTMSTTPLSMTGSHITTATTGTTASNQSSEASGARRSQQSSMRFTSSLVPETKITNDGEEETERTIMFAHTGTSTPTSDRPERPERPPFSRTNSRQSHVSLADSFTKKKAKEAKEANDLKEAKAAHTRPSVSFVEPNRDVQQTLQQTLNRPLPPSQMSRHLSAANSPGLAGVSGSAGVLVGPEQEQGGDVRVGISGLLADYKAHQKAGSSGSDDGHGSSGSSYATQDMPLSFNDLPSRAQHLILNELMRRHSGRGEEAAGKKKAVEGEASQTGSGAAVLLTTLPIPDEGTCRDETASVQYLADVELLCQGLPPVLMILSNNMTVTVSL